MHRALDRLPAEQRALLTRRHLAGAGRQEVASALGLTLSQYETRHAVAWSALTRGHVSPAHVAARLVECLNCRLARRRALSAG